MKLLINYEKRWSLTFSPPITQDEYDEYAYDKERLEEKLTRLGVYHRIDLAESDITVTIEVQKIVLDELLMNEFINEMYYLFPSVDIQYAALGGSGCEFSFEWV